MPTPVSLLITSTNLTNPQHATAFTCLMDHYARSPAGGGEALASQVYDDLLQRLPGFPGFHSWLAWLDGEAVGLLNAFTGFSTFAARPLLNLHDIVVLEAWRGRGIGQALMQAAEQHAREAGCCKLTLEVLTHNQSAYRTYLHQGYQPYQLDPAMGQAILLQKYL